MSEKKGESHKDNMLGTGGHNCSPNLFPAVAVIAPANWLFKQNRQLRKCAFARS